MADSKTGWTSCGDVAVAGDGDRRAGRTLLAALLLFAVAIAFSGTSVGPALAQTTSPDDTTKLADEIIRCAGMDDSDARLKCYDALARPLLGLDKSSEGVGAGILERFTGTGDWDSDAFEVKTSWRLVWQSQGSLLTVELRTPQNELIDVIGNQIGSGGGRSGVLSPGRYRLAVRGLGGWRVQVIKAE